MRVPVVIYKFPTVSQLRTPRWHLACGSPELDVYGIMMYMTKQSIHRKTRSETSRQSHMEQERETEKGKLKEKGQW